MLYVSEYVKPTLQQSQLHFRTEQIMVVLWPGTEFMGGQGGHVPPNFSTERDIISFVSPNIL